MLERPSRSVNGCRSALAQLLALGLLTLGGPGHACPPDPQGLLVDYEVVAPLVAHLGPVLRLRIDEAGCAEIHRPTIFRHPGTHRQALSAAELAALAAEIAALPRDLDQAARKLAREPSPAEGFAVADAPLRRFLLRPTGAAPIAFAWPGLEQDALNHPGDPRVIAAASLAERLEGIAARIEREAKR